MHVDNYSQPQCFQPRRRVIRSILAAIILICSGCSALFVNPPDVSLVDLKVGEVTIFETGVSLVVRYQNRDDRPLVISGAEHEITLNGKYLGRGSSSTVLNIPAYGTATDTIKVHLSNLSLFNRIQELVEQPKLQYQIDNSISVGGTFGGRVSSQSSGELNLDSLNSPAKKTIKSIPDNLPRTF